MLEGRLAGKEIRRGLAKLSFIFKRRDNNIKEGQKRCDKPYDKNYVSAGFAKNKTNGGFLGGDAAILILPFRSENTELSHGQNQNNDKEDH